MQAYKVALAAERRQQRSGQLALPAPSPDSSSGCACVCRLGGTQLSPNLSAAGCRANALLLRDVHGAFALLAAINLHSNQCKTAAVSHYAE